MKTKLPLVALAAVLVLSGCAGTIVTDFTQRSPGTNAFAPIPALSAVKCGEKLRAHEITLKNMGSALVYKNGAVFAETFSGGDSAPATVELVNARVDEAMEPGWVLDKKQLRYTVTVAVESRGQKHILTATGFGAAMGPDGAMREAVQKVTADLAAQVKAVL